MNELTNATVKIIMRFNKQKKLLYSKLLNNSVLIFVDFLHCINIVTTWASLLIKK